LQQISANIAVSSPMNDFKRTATLRRGQSEFGLQSELSAGGHYHGLPNSYDPIFGGDHRHTPSYANPHPGSQSFDGRNAFHPINQPFNGLPYDSNPYPYQSPHLANFFPAAGGYTDTNEFTM
jgi:hypothetical protein